MLSKSSGLRGLCLVAALIVSSCVEEIMLDPMEEMPVVVCCVLTGGSSMQSVDLYYARRPSESVFIPIPDANVVVRERNSLPDVVYQFKWNGENYVCEFVPVHNTSYVLEVETAGGKHFFAETIMPDNYALVPQKPEENVFFQVLDSDFDDDSFLYWPLFTGRLEYRQYRSYYFARVSEDGATEPYSGELYAWILAGERLSTNHIDADAFNVLPDNWCSLKTHPLFTPFNSWRDLPEMASFYEYFSDLPAFQRFVRIHQQNGFSGNVPPQYASVGGLDRYDHLFVLNSDPTDETIYKRIYPDLDDETRNWYFRRTTPYVPVQNEYTVRFLSKEYDALLKDLIKKKIIRADQLAELFSTKPVYSNIDGGLGIFGAETVGKAPFFYRCGVQYTE